MTPPRAGERGMDDLLDGHDGGRMAVSLVVLIAPAESVTALKTETAFRKDILVLLC